MPLPTQPGTVYWMPRRAAFAVANVHGGITYLTQPVGTSAFGSTETPQAFPGDGLHWRCVLVPYSIDDLAHATEYCVGEWMWRVPRHAIAGHTGPDGNRNIQDNSLWGQR